MYSRERVGFVSRLATEERFDEFDIPDYGEGGRDAGALSQLIASTKSKINSERESAYRELLKAIERVDMEKDVAVVVQIYEAFKRWAEDPETVVRQGLLEPMPFLFGLAQQCPALENFADVVFTPYLIRCLTGSDSTRKLAVTALGALIEHNQLAQEAWRTEIVPRLFELSAASDEGVYASDEQRMEAASVLCKIISFRLVTDRLWLLENFIERYTHFLSDIVVHIRKSAVAIFGDLALLMGTRFTDEFLVPHMIATCDDSNWGVRKSVCETFVSVAKCASEDVRRIALAPRFVRLLNDTSRWVSFVAYQELGPLIATFADSSRTGLKILDGKVCECSRNDLELDASVDDDLDLSVYDWFHRKSEDESDESSAEDRTDPDALATMQTMFSEWSANERMIEMRSAPPSVIDIDDVRSGMDLLQVTSEAKEIVSTSIAARCSSYDDLSNFPDEPEYTETDDACNSDSEELADVSFMDSPKEDKCEEDLFSDSSYWSPPNIVTSDEDLAAFGTSQLSPSSREFLERRLDVFCGRQITDRSHVDGKHAIITEEKVVHEQSTTADQNIPTDSSSLSIDHATTSSQSPPKSPHAEVFADCRDVEDLTPSDEKEPSSCAVAEHTVPLELLENFTAMATSWKNGDYADLNRQCAHNMPAVAFTLGRENWSALRETYAQLAADDHWRVRVSIAHSIHEIAAIVGPQFTEEDLLPIFHTLREDVSDVRLGLLKHLYEFYKCLTPKVRQEMISVLPQFMPLESSMQNGCWRFRFEFARQCKKLCDMYGLEDMNQTMGAIALTLANDKVADVRKEGVLLLSRIIGRMLSCEAQAGNSKDLPTTVLFINDLVQGFAISQKWTRRQTFASVCEQVLASEAMSLQQFENLLQKHLLRLAYDKVANVRIAVCAALSRCRGVKNTLTAFSTDACEAMHVLLIDRDMDVARCARYASGRKMEKELIDITSRGERIARKEAGIDTDEYYGLIATADTTLSSSSCSVTEYEHADMDMNHVDHFEQADEDNSTSSGTCDTTVDNYDHVDMDIES